MILDKFQKTLDDLSFSSNLRHLPKAVNNGKYVKPRLVQARINSKTGERIDYSRPPE